MKEFPKIYISLTTIKNRVNYLPQVIESLLGQNLKADLIFLNVSKEAYLLDEGISETDIPAEVLNWKKEGLVKVNFVKNTGPYRKLLPVLQEKYEENCIIVTADDDVIYPPDWLEKMIKTSQEYPDSIISYRNRYIQYEGRELGEYDTWPLINGDFYFKNGYTLNNKFIFPTGTSGILYKPRFFKKEIFDSGYLATCRSRADVWFKFMAMYSGTETKIIISRYLDLGFENIQTSVKKRLYSYNKKYSGKKSKNDLQIMQTIAYIKDSFGYDILEDLSRNRKVMRDVGIPELRKKLDGKIWAITSFFNPSGYATKLKNYNQFRENLKKQHVNLCTVELAFNKKPFELDHDSAEQLIQIRGDDNNIVWQKEALLNITLKALPKDCDKVVWIDCDIIFKNDNWIHELSRKLEIYNIVQPFDICVLMPQNKTIEEIEIAKLEIGKLDGQKRHSIAYSRCKNKDRSGHPGLVWAARREVLDQVGFYDRGIIGSGDVLLSDSFYSPSLHVKKYGMSSFMIEDMSRFSEKMFEQVKGSVGFMKGTIYHLWHGQRIHRRYLERVIFLKIYNFNPLEHVFLNKNRILEWSDSRNKIKIFVKRYFTIRNEDGSPGGNIKTFFTFDMYCLLDARRIMLYTNFKRNVILSRVALYTKNISPKLYYFLKKHIPR